MYLKGVFIENAKLLEANQQQYAEVLKNLLARNRALGEKSMVGHLSLFFVACLSLNPLLSSWRDRSPFRSSYR